MAYRNRRAAVLLAGLFLTLAAASCGMVTGLSAYSEGTCSSECDAGADRSSVADASPDAGSDPEESAADVGASDDAPMADEGAQDDGAQDDGPQDGAFTDAGAESGVDAADEAGCGPVDTVANCSACGVTCSSSTGTPSCSGSTCSYACNANRQDCNRATAPDTDGCECAGSGCCGTGCQTIHTSGVPSPSSYGNCNAKGNTTQTQAMAACAATSGSGCSAKNTTCGGIFGFGGTSTSGVCGTVGSTCYCWIYSGQNAGEAQTGSSGCNIACSSGSSWN